MILASHIIISGILASKTPNYFLAAAIGLISHYVLDTIPHWDYLSEEFESGAKTDKNFVKRKKFWQELFKITIDILAGFVVLFIFIKFYDNINIVPLIISVFFSILPDSLSFLYWITNWKIIKWNHDIQLFAHRLIIKTVPKFPSGLVIQIITIGIVFFMLYKL